MSVGRHLQLCLSFLWPQLYSIMKNRLVGSGTRAYRFNSKLHKDQMPIKARPFMVPSKIVTLLAYCAPFYRWDVRQYNMWISASRERGGINEQSHTLFYSRRGQGIFPGTGPIDHEYHFLPPPIAAPSLWLLYITYIVSLKGCILSIAGENPITGNYWRYPAMSFKEDEKDSSGAAELVH